MLKVGILAPDFEAISDDGNKIRLSQFRGKYIILYFYPKDESPGCTVEACSFRDNWDEIKKYDAVIIGVSSDSVDSHKKFKEKHSLPFILVSDENKKIRELYDAKGFLLPSRITYIIDKEGKIAFAYNSQFKASEHVKKVIEFLDIQKNK
jgi:peroxiredoxin Q/BCP